MGAEFDNMREVAVADQMLAEIDDWLRTTPDAEWWDFYIKASEITRACADMGPSVLRTMVALGSKVVYEEANRRMANSDDEGRSA